MLVSSLGWLHMAPAVLRMRCAAPPRKPETGAALTTQPVQATQPVPKALFAGLAATLATIAHPRVHRQRRTTSCANGPDASFKKGGFTADDMEKAYEDFFDKVLDAPPPRIVVIGKRGVGKSTLINSLRSLKPTDEGAAAVGLDETTIEGTRYNHFGMIFHDLPGFEGSEETAQMGAEYISKYELNKADACIFMYTTVLEPRMLHCAVSLHRDHKVPTFLVRNRVGQDCRDEEDNGNSESLQEAFDKIHSRALEQISQAGPDCDIFKEKSRLFLVEAKYKDAVHAEPKEPFQKEFHRLKDALRTQSRDEARRAQTDAILAKDAKALAAARAEVCRNCVLGHAAFSMLGIVVIGGEHLLRRYVVRRFMRQFGLTEDYLTQLNNSGLMVAALGRQSAPKEVLDQIVVTVAGEALQPIIMWRFCERVINELESRAEKFYSLGMQDKLLPSRPTLYLTGDACDQPGA